MVDELVGHGELVDEPATPLEGVASVDPGALWPPNIPTRSAPYIPRVSVVGGEDFDDVSPAAVPLPNWFDL